MVMVFTLSISVNISVYIRLASKNHGEWGFEYSLCGMGAGGEVVNRGSIIARSQRLEAMKERATGTGTVRECKAGDSKGGATAPLWGQGAKPLQDAIRRLFSHPVQG